jgi:anti-anti-sigma regulatory factor
VKLTFSSLQPSPRAIYRAPHADDGNHVLIDLDGVTFLDSARIHAVVMGYHDAVRLGAGFATGAGPANIAPVLALTGLGDCLTAEPAVKKWPSRRIGPAAFARSSSTK